MSAPVRRLVPVPMLVGSQIEAYGARVRSGALRDVADWLVEVGEDNAAYLLRTCEVPRGALDQDEDDARGGVQSYGVESTGPNPVRPHVLPDANTDRALQRARIGGYFAGAYWARVAREAGAIEL